METSVRFPAYKRRFGWCNFRPDCLQFLCKPEWALFFICCGVFLQGFLINGLLHIVLPSLERRFNLKSSETGMIVGSYDMSSVVLLIPITYYGGLPRASKPLWYGTGMMLLGIGSLTFIIPECIVSSRSYMEIYSPPPICNESHHTNREEVCQNRSHRLSTVIWIFLSSSLLCGVGGCIIFTLAVIYIDDSVSKTKSAIFLGLFYLSLVSGTATGFVIGGLFLQIRSSFFIPKQAVEEIQRQQYEHLNPEDASFQGAWWLGFLLSGIIFLIIAIPNLGFPAQLPGAELIRASKISESHSIAQPLLTQDDINIKNMVLSLWNIVKNPTFMFLSLAACFDALILNGSSVFLPKILENQYNVNSKLSAIIIGSIAVLGGVIGILTGGMIVKVLKLNCRNAIKMCIYSSTVTSVCLPVLLLHCREKKFAGLSISYKNDTIMNPRDLFPFHSSCNSRCTCHEENYSPICGVDGINYYSACFAGCNGFRVRPGGIQEFLNCSCIKTELSPEEPQATSKNCSLFCPHIIIFIIAIANGLLFLFIAVVPGIIASLRCVDISQRSLATGMQWVMIRAFGIFGLSWIGKNIDLACLHWEKKCVEHGSCVLYDNKEFSLRMFFLAIGAKIITLVSLLISFLSYKPLQVHEEALPTQPSEVAEVTNSIKNKN